MVSQRSQNLLCALLVTTLQIVVASTVLCAGTPVKDFSLPSATDGRVVHLADFSGKVVLINFWRTSCSDSRREAPKLVNLYRKYHDQGFEIFGVSDDTSDSVGQIPTYMKQYGITWPIGLNDQAEFMRELYKPVDPGGTPSNFLVSRSGEVTPLGKDLNDESWKKLETAVIRALADSAPDHAMIATRELPVAPPLSLPDLGGKTVKLANLAGKPIVVNFFTSQSCDWTGAVVSKLHRNYAARGLQVVGIDLYDSDNAVRQCAQKYGAQYPILRGDQRTQTAWIGGNNGWATFFITSDGKILKKIVDSIEKGIEEPVFTKYADYLVRGH